MRYIDRPMVVMMFAILATDGIWEFIIIYLSVLIPWTVVNHFLSK